MSLPDAVNSAYEGLGALMVLLNIRQVLRDRQVRGMHLGALLFFTSWGYWNLFYYAHLAQWLSWTCGCLLALANTIWLGLCLRYRTTGKDVVNVE